MSSDPSSIERPPKGLASLWHALSIRPDLIFWTLVGLCVLLVLFDFGYHNFSAHGKHGHFPFETIIGFHAAYGFGAFAFVVMTGSKMRRFLKRDVGYYDIPKDTPKDDGHSHGHEEEHSGGHD